MKPLKIKVVKDETTGEFSWEMTSNGRHIATSSTTYKRRASCLAMAEKVASNTIEVETA